MSVPELVIESGSRPPLLQSLRELWAYRGTIVAFAERDVRVKYKQAVLGVAWAIVQPLTYMIVFTVIFGRFGRISGGGTNYEAFSLASVTAWQFLQTGVSFASGAVLGNAALVRKVYFPKEVPVVGSILAAGLDYAIGLALFYAIGPFLGAKISFTWLLAPVLGLILALLAVGIGCIFSALNVYYRDFRYALPFLMQLWLLASPVAFPVTQVPFEWRTLYVIVNPAAGVLDAYRNVLALGRLPHPGYLMLSLTSALLLSYVGYRVFKTLERNFADVI